MCLPMLGAVVGLAGAVVSGIGAAQQAQQQAANHEAEAALKDRQAEVNAETAIYEQDRTRDVVERTLGAQRAGYAANGIALDGSAVDVIADTATEGALDIAAIQWNSDLKTDNLKYEAKIDRMNADGARSSAGLAFLAPVLGGVAKFGGAF